MPSKQLCAALVLPALLLLLVGPARAEEVRRSLAPGIELVQQILPPPEGPLVVTLLRVDPRAPGVRIRSALGRDVILTEEPARGRENLAPLAERHGALAAINADYFPFTGDPLGVAVVGGQLVSEPRPNRAAVGFTADGRPRFDVLVGVGSVFAADGGAAPLDGINRAPGKDELVLLTPAFGTKAPAGKDWAAASLAGLSPALRAGVESAAAVESCGEAEGNVAVPAGGALLVASGRAAAWLREHGRPGDRLRIRYDLAAMPLPPGPPRGALADRSAALRGRISASAWQDVEEAVSGGPWLVRDGRIHVDGVEQGFPEQSFVKARHPRTALGATASGEVLLVAVDGRQPHSRGATLEELAALMLRLGAVQAVNLDGGGSTALWARGLYLNGPSDGAPRPVANALLVFGQAEPLQDAGPPATVTLNAGETAALPPPPDAAGGGILWGTVDGRGFVDQLGRLSATRAGTLAAASVMSARRHTVTCTVIPGPPARLRAVLGAAPNDPPDRSVVTATVTDRFGNPLPDVEVVFAPKGGTADPARARTDVRGQAAAEIVWDVETGRSVVVCTGGLSSAVVRGR